MQSLDSAQLVHTWFSNHCKVELFFSKTSQKIHAVITDANQNFFSMQETGHPFSKIHLPQQLPSVREFSKIQAFFQSVYPRPIYSEEQCSYNLYFNPRLLGGVPDGDDNDEDPDIKKLREAKQGHERATSATKKNLADRAASSERTYNQATADIDQYEKQALQKQQKQLDALRRQMDVEAAEEAEEEQRERGSSIKRKPESPASSRPHQVARRDSTDDGEDFEEEGNCCCGPQSSKCVIL